jgi:hypothetical protein
VSYLADCLIWLFCGLAYRLFLILPTGRRNGPATWLYWKLLPFAGFYGYHERGMNWRWSGRVR